MKKILRQALLLAIVSSIIPLTIIARTPTSETEIEQPEAVEVKVEEPQVDPLAHRKEVWLSALEWCESHGNHNAINPKDLDGTASYYSFQFKPQTFKVYGIKYELLEPGLENADYFNLMSDYELMRDIVRHMIEDKSVVWSQQFPACTQQIGLPPR